MTKTVLFIHSAGSQGRHQGSNDFVALLKKSLGTRYAVKYPKMPNPDAPESEPWKVRIGKEIAGLGDGAILIGHSLGGSMILKSLSEEPCETSFAALFLVATPFWGLQGWEYETFYLKKGFAKTLPPIDRIFIYHTLDDDTVSKAHAARYARSLPRAIVRKVDGFGHAFAAKPCPELIRDLKSI